MGVSFETNFSWSLQNSAFKSLFQAEQLLLDICMSDF